MSPSGQGKTVLPLCSRQGGSRLPKPSPEQTREPEMVEAQHSSTFISPKKEAVEDLKVYYVL